MSFDRSRRSVLRGAAITLATTGAGCAKTSTTVTVQTSTSAGSPDPDAGTEQYGLFVRNDTDDAHRLRVSVERPWEQVTKFEKLVSLDGGSTREWDTVVQQNKKWAFVARLDEAIESNPDTGDKQHDLVDRKWIKPGAESAPHIANIQCVITDTRGLEVYFTWNGQN